MGGDGGNLCAIVMFCLFFWVLYLLIFYDDEVVLFKKDFPVLEGYELDKETVYIEQRGRTKGYTVIHKYIKKRPPLPPVEYINEFGEIEPCF